MGVTVAVTRAAVNTATGTQDFSTPDLAGLTPKAAYFIVSYATADGTAADHAMLGIGAVTDATHRWALAVSQEHGITTSDTYNSGSVTTCVRILNPTDGSVDGEADFDSWLADGIRINWTNAPSAAFLLTVVLFAGSDLTAHANNVSLGDTVDNAVDVTAPGFRPDLVLCGLVPTVVGTLSWGFVHEDGAGTVAQQCLVAGSRDAVTTVANWTMMRTDSGVCEIAIGGLIDWYGEFGSFDSSGFTVTTRTAGANNCVLGYLALDFGGVAESWVGTLTTPTATGNQAITAPNFTPQLVMLIPTLVSTAASQTVDSRAHSSGVIVIDADEQYSTVITSQDAATTSNAQSLSDNVAASVPDHTGALDIEATLVSLDATGWTLNFSNINAVAKLWPALAIEEFVGGGGGGVPKHFMHYQRMGAT